MAHDAFISYTTTDKAAADAVCHRLEEAGIRCWIAPRDVGYGKDWGASIVEAIGDAKLVVVIFSAAANASRHILDEVGTALDTGATVIPFRIEDILPTGALRLHLNRLHWLDALSLPLDAHIDRLIENAKRNLPAAADAKEASPQQEELPRQLVEEPRRILQEAPPGPRKLFGRWPAVAAVVVVAAVLVSALALTLSGVIRTPLSPHIKQALTSPPAPAPSAPAPQPASVPVPQPTPPPAPRPAQAPLSGGEGFGVADVKKGNEAYDAKDYGQAMSWYRMAADQGNAAAQNNIGELYQNGKGVTQDYAQAMSWYRKAADQGDAFTQINIGLLYENGNGVTQDYGQAMSWYRMAADQGNASGQNHIGWLYQNGKGVTQDYAEAMSWYRKAADQGNATAQNNIGNLIENGRGVTQDYVEAMSWYRKAADQGNTTAQGNIGWLYEHGKGVKKNNAQAISWYRKAADQGNADAAIALNKLRPR